MEFRFGIHCISDSDLAEEFRFARESISNLPELVAEDFRLEIHGISDSDLAEELRFERESISDLPELVAEDFRFGIHGISDSDLAEEFRFELPDDFRHLTRVLIISELPGERILKCLKFRKDRMTTKQDRILMEFYDGGELFFDKVHVDRWIFDRLPYADLPRITSLPTNHAKVILK